LIALILTAILLLIALYSFRELLRTSYPAVWAKARRPLLWLGLLLFAGLAARLGWVVPLLGALAAAAVRLAPILVALAPALLRRFLPGHGQHADSNRDAPPPSPASGRMSHAEAYEILGLAPGATREEIISAHRRLMQKVHPDRGGSDYLAGKINLARETLLAR
jgi:hypothetical protein